MIDESHSAISGEGQTAGAPMAARTFRLADHHRNELEKIAPGLRAVADRIERVIGRFIGRDERPERDPFGSALEQAFYRRDDYYHNIADKSASLLAELERLASDMHAHPWLPEELGPELARFGGEEEVARLNAMPNHAREAWLRAAGPAALKAAMNEIAALATTARRVHDARALPSPERGQPAKYDQLVDGLEGAVFEAFEGLQDWEANWAPWHSATGRFCRLVALALEAAQGHAQDEVEAGRAESVHPNIGQLVRRARARLQASAEAEMVADEAWEQRLATAEMAAAAARKQAQPGK